MLCSQEEDFPGAIQLCLECQKAASTYKHYQCIRSASHVGVKSVLALCETN